MHLDRSFQFRGDRRYLHSASLFDDLLKLRGPEPTDIDMTFHRETAQQVSYVDQLPTPSCQPVADWRDSQGRVLVIERDEPMRDTTPYNEAELVQMLDVDQRTVHIPAEILGFSRIEALIAGFKHLLQSVYPEHVRKYVFVRVRLKHCPTGAVQITYARDIGGFFQGDILEDSARLGQIFFGVWE